MSDINLNTHPYWDDFDESKDYQRILFIPTRAPQARELTQLQTITQHQVRKLADSLYKNGTILRGCLMTINSSKTQVTVTAGDVYVDGWVITFDESVSIPITGTGTEIVGLVKYESIVTEVDDKTLRDPAQGCDNYNEPGGNRLKVLWSWELIDPNEEDAVNVSYKLGIFTVLDGESNQELVIAPDITQQILDITAKRDYMKSGNYVLDGLKLKLLDHQTDRLNKKCLVVASGTARLQGYDVVVSTDQSVDIPISRDVATVTSEPWVFDPYDYSTGLGGSYRLGQRPVSSVRKVIATVLTCDGYGDNPSIVRGGIPGGSDSLSKTSVESIIGVNYGGTWTPLGNNGLGSFVGGVNYVEGLDFAKDGNRIDWSLNGIEPPIGVNYKVAYTYRKTLTKEIYEMTHVSFESHVHGSNDIITHPYLCEMNEFTGAVFYVADPVGTDPPTVEETSDYIDDVDFTLDSTGLLEWFDYEYQVIEVLRGVGSTDSISGLSDGYEFYQIAAVASYGEGTEYSFDPATLSFVQANASYQETSDYSYEIADAVITWSGDAPSQGDTYVIAVRGRKYKTDNHPTEGHTYYITYDYWFNHVAGDYISRDSYYKTWYGSTDIRNVQQRYGLDITETINFWMSDSYNSNLGLMNKPYPDSLVEIDYDYCLSKYAVIELDKINGIVVTYGNASDTPTEPVYDEKVTSIMLGKLFMPADSISMVITEFGVVTMKVLDLHNLRDRVLRTELNLADTWLDMEAKSMEVTSKKGISTSSFRTTDRFDLGWEGSSFSIDPDWEELSFPHTDYLYYTEVDETLSTGKVYTTVCTLVPNGTEQISQPYYTHQESIAPFATVSQSLLQQSQSVYMNLFPSGDPLVVPKSSTLSGTSTDSNLWANSSVSQLSDPSPWFAGGWRGNQQSEVANSDQVSTVTNTTLSASWSSEYISGITGVCRQLSVIFDIPGGLNPVANTDLDYFVYFGGVLVDITLINDTPNGSVSNSFRSRTSDNGATGRFTIPPNIPAGNIEVKVISSPVQVNGNDWRVTMSAIYTATVTSQLTTVFNRCRCNCYGCNRCSNCWSCTGRCGTGPLAETLEAPGKLRILKEIEYDFYSTNPFYGVFGSVIKTDNGSPTSNTISDALVGRKFMSPSFLSGAGPKVCTFDDPVYLANETYATILTAEDGFNLNYQTEVTAARDIKVKTAQLGYKDKVTNVSVGSQPFPEGTFWRSLTGFSWDQDASTDLKFKATFNTYSTSTEQIIYTETFDTYDATAFICTWNSFQPDGTSIVFEYRTDQESWTEFAPYVLTYLTSVASTISFRARLRTGLSNVTPFLERFCGVYVQSSATSMKAVTRLFELAVGETADTLDLWLDSYLPSGCTQTLRVTFDNGDNWVLLDREDGGLPDPSPATVTSNNYVTDANVDNYKVTYHWNVVLSGAHYSNFRVEVTSQSTGLSAKLTRPRFSKYIAITSNS